MAVLMLERGGMCHVSEEDLEAAREIRWRLSELKPSGNPCAWTRLQQRGRRFDLFLHRRIAILMRPELAKRNFTVIPLDGDYLNCVRENLEIVVRKKPPGPARKPGNRARSRFVHFTEDGEFVRLWRPAVARQGR